MDGCMRAGRLPKGMKGRRVVVVGSDGNRGALVTRVLFFTFFHVLSCIFVEH